VGELTQSVCTPPARRTHLLIRCDRGRGRSSVHARCWVALPRQQRCDHHFTQHTLHACILCVIPSHSLVHDAQARLEVELQQVNARRGVAQREHAAVKAAYESLYAAVS